jgi:type II secretory pathway pseudopilin PulG
VKQVQPATKERGFSYVEVLISVVLIAVALVPAMEALTPAIQGITVAEAAITEHYHLKAKLEETLALPFDDLSQEAENLGDPAIFSAVYSDPPAAQSRRLVYLAHIDADNADADDNAFTGAETDLLWIRVAISGSHRRLDSVMVSDE